jgi:tRNA (guanine9-N1)-methyltransferase
MLIDCDFENLMNDKDIVSTVRQLTDIYSTNRKSKEPFNVIFYDVGEKIHEGLVKNNFINWLGMKMVKKGDYISMKEYIKNIQGGKELVYLTADSENEITDLDSTTVYIIGGIVDRNKYKLLTYEKAKEMGIKHARLPIAEYLHLKSSKILATNHVFSIMSHFQTVKNWKDAFMSIIPKRKLEE